MNVAFQHRDVDGFIDGLVAGNRIGAEAARRLRAARAATSHPFDTVVIELGLMREDALAAALGEYFNTDHVERPGEVADPQGIDLFGHGFLASRAIVPAGHDEDGFSVFIVADPFDRDTLNLVGYQLDAPLRLRMATRGAINAYLASAVEPAIEDDGAGIEEASDSDLERLKDFARQAPIVRLVSRVVQQAVDQNATDIHIEPNAQDIRIRTRVDGMLKLAETAPLTQLPGIATRVKLLAGLDIAERRMPQDGRMRVTVRGQEIDLRVSVVPSVHGETIALRILDRSTVALDLPALGYDEDAREKLLGLARKQHGILLVTGPTGSGKTTTLYSLLSILADPAVKIFTVEDPVEYRMDGITQLQTQSGIGLTFARALRSVLRQDPDIILVGEIRDRETAEIAMQAALTGHLVLSTLHTNSAIGAVTRLRDMGIPDYLISATVAGIVGQRLLRRACSCGGEAGCPNCGGTGYHGRIATFEIAEITDTIARRISAGESEDKLVDLMKDAGLVPMSRHAAQLVEQGVTTKAEVTRVVQLGGGA